MTSKTRMPVRVNSFNVVSPINVNIPFKLEITQSTKEQSALDSKKFLNQQPSKFEKNTT